ncbi:MAG: hypothetical protein KDB57_11495 [Solirubrobacterales bacterium]|jgi:hypothetical protein|nr:hypothetical protein [Solirubrobacterales bacterium]
MPDSPPAIPGSTPSRPFLKRRLAAVVGTVLGIIVLAGCGGSDEEDLTRTDYIADADAICAQYGTESADLERQFNQALLESDLESAAQSFEDQASEVTAMLDQLEELTPPVADQATVDQIIALGRQRVETAQDAADAIASGDKDAMIAAGKEGSVLAGEYYQLADGFGFETCGSGGATTDAASTTGTTGETS